MTATTPKAWDESMGEISGFGGGYEAVCRAMVLAGIAWIDQHPQAEIIFGGFKNVFGLVTEENEDAKALTAAMMDAPVPGVQARAGDDATGAMHHAAVQHCLAYKRLGWDEYVRQLVAREKTEKEGS